MDTRKDYVHLTNVALYEARKKKRQDRLDNQEVIASIVLGAVIGLVVLKLMQYLLWGLRVEGLL